MLAPPQHTLTTQLVLIMAERRYVQVEAEKL